VSEADATRRIAAEFVGCAGLTAVVVGSGAAAASLTDDVGLALLINAVATALGLFVLIEVFGPLSGAHLNPVVSLVDVVTGHRRRADLLGYVPAQVLGCIAGAVLANIMFGEPAVSWSATDRATPAHLLAEVVATAGLVVVIFALVRLDKVAVIPLAVGAYIGSAYFFTSSTSFANPAITIGRMFTDTFAGIAPGSAPWFIGAQLVGGALGALVVIVLFGARARVRTP
jgi:glycerol uptake facilitator-like aquaporin